MYWVCLLFQLYSQIVLSILGVNNSKSSGPLMQRCQLYPGKMASINEVTTSSIVLTPSHSFGTFWAYSVKRAFINDVTKVWKSPSSFKIYPLSLLCNVLSWILVKVHSLMTSLKFDNLQPLPYLRIVTLVPILGKTGAVRLWCCSSLTTSILYHFYFELKGNLACRDICSYPNLI